MLQTSYCNGQLLILGVLGLFGITSCQVIENMEKKLLNTILSGHSNSLGAIFARPVHFPNITLYMTLDLALIQMNFDEKKKTLNLSAWTKFTWTDAFLTWDPNQYGGLDRIRIDPSFIWMPDVQLQNTGNVAKSSRDTKAQVMFDGYVMYYTLVHYSVSCALNLTNFPFDTQKCQLLMSSWLYNANEVDIGIRAGGIDLSNWGRDFKEASSWEILNTTGIKSYIPANPNVTTKYAIAIFELTLKRKVVFSTYILTLPCVFLSFLTISVFWLPPHRPDRTALAMNTFASFMLLLLILVESAPPTTSTVPLLGVYYCLNIVSIVVAIILSTIVVNLAKGSSRPVPKCILTVIYSRFGRILMLHDAPTDTFHRSNTGNHRNSSSTKNNLLFRDLSESEPNISRDAVNRVDLELACCSGCKASAQIKKISEELRMLRSNLRNIAEQTQKGQYKKKNGLIYRREWELFGIFLDRIFCIFYILLAIFALVFFFPSPGKMPS